MDNSRAIALKLIAACYGYSLFMASANVVNCEARRQGECGDQWTQAFTVAGGATTTVWAYITESPPSKDSKKSRANTREAEPLS